MKRWCVALTMMLALGWETSARAEPLRLLSPGLMQQHAAPFHLLPAGSGDDDDDRPRFWEMGAISLVSQNAIFGVAGYITFRALFQNGSHALNSDQQSTLITLGLMIDMFVIPVVSTAVMMKVAGLDVSCGSLMVISSLAMIANISTASLAFGFMLALKTTVLSGLLVTMEAGFLGTTIADMLLVYLTRAIKRHMEPPPPDVPSPVTRPFKRVPDPREGVAAGASTTPLLAFAF